MATDVLSVRPVSRRVWPQRLRLVGGAGPRYWNGRLVLRFGIAGVPVGALAGILVGLVVLRQGLTDALWSYAYGAGVGLLVGMVVGGLLGVLGALVAGMRWSRPAQDQRRLWVRHRTDGAVTLRR